MHFSIPETEALSADNGSTYVAYNIHVNGVLHCRVRYSELYGLHEQLRKEYGTNVLPHFPPKKIFTLTAAEVEQRREQLEKYIQSVRQDCLLGGSEAFNSFLRKAQQETQQIPTQEVQLDVYLSNGQKVKVNIFSSDQTEDVLEAVAAKLDLPDDLVGYFSLFLIREGSDDSCSFVRKLQEFELPYISVTSLKNTEYRIVLRKSYWDTAYDNDVMENRVGLNLLYAQTVADIERGWILVNKEQHRQLKSLQEKGSKKEQVPLMNGTANSPGKTETKLELAFEYLMSKDRLQWVTISSPQAIMMSISLQAMVDELMVKKSGGNIKKMLKKRMNGALRRSDSQQAVKSPPLLDSPDSNREPIVKLSSKLSSVSIRGIGTSNSSSDIRANDFHGNYAFEGIGDDDL
ncbi:sorting nexin-17 isoform X5 [Carcharodon carcharias]|uniref:sorting nexin-17 isoform X5 n=1 Tax=Carcharodon carcharias TaxID=13397 RepID=UPI001B7E301A|nr:sorting nexin-17 isoform X5 [Carcharodon carcharias]